MSQSFNILPIDTERKMELCMVGDEIDITSVITEELLKKPSIN